MKLRLHDGSIVEASVTPWTTSGDTVTKYLVVLPGIGSTFLSPEELAERRLVTCPKCGKRDEAQYLIPTCRDCGNRF